MKKYLLPIVAFYLTGAALLLAQSTNVTIDPATAPLPQTTSEWWTWAIAAVTPMIVWICRKLAPRVPTIFIPFSAAAIGMGLAYALNKIGASHFTWWDAAQAGALSVAVREAWNQAVTKGVIGGTSTKAVQ